MIIRDKNELRQFEETLERCDSTVLLVTAGGDQYDLKDPVERYLGIANMINAPAPEEPEIFASSKEDEVCLLNFFASMDKKTA